MLVSSSQISGHPNGLDSDPFDYIIEAANGFIGAQTRALPEGADSNVLKEAKLAILHCSYRSMAKKTWSSCRSTL